MAHSLTAPVAVEYPSSDGKPMAESKYQLIPLAYAYDALERHFRRRRDVFVGADMFVYYRRGDPKARVAPDVMVVVGTRDHLRHSYLLWEEPKGPDFVLEITSRKTWREDQGRKRQLYRELGVTEYWQYDPTSDYLEPRLQGLRLSGGKYLRLPERALADGTTSLHSKALDLELCLPGGELRFYDTVTQRYLLSSEETEQAWRGERQARQQAEQLRQQAEQQRHREAAARRRAEQEREREVTARKAAEARLAELEARLRERGDQRRP